MREIGSEFWDVPTCDERNFLFSESPHWFLSGRSALKAVIADIQKGDKQVNSISLPSWCCDSIICPFLEADMEVSFYPVLGSEQQLDNITTDVVLVMDFFGYTGYSQMENYQGIVIRDVTHSLFSKQYDDADYYFGSLRKWAGFYTGGYAWGFKGSLPQLPENPDYVRLRREAMEAKKAYMEGTSDSKDYLKTFGQAEDMLEHCGVERADGRDCESAFKLDVNFVKQRRQYNASILLDAFEHVAIFKDFQECDCPMFVPVLVPNGLRDNLRKYLIGNQIYCPVHWPVTEFHQLTTKERFIYNNELSLVCDQRYDGDDMHRIIDTIHEFLTKKSC